jgi:iron complex outermembrane receptor protein
MTSGFSARTRGCRLFVRAASLLLVIATPALARAESCASSGVAAEARQWPAPLDRRVTLHARSLVLRDALDRLAAAARIRLSYSAELLSLDRHVCVSYDSVAAGTVLSDLINGADVSPMIAGADQVVLAPSPHRPTASVERAGDVNVLDRVLVTGTAVGAPERGVTADVRIIDRAQLARQSTAGASLSQMLNSAVPGVWLWEQAPTSFLAQYGSLRGASSLQVSYPKIYIDGIEVANPLLLTELSPDAVERIEVIRGPQGAALYGADAIAGVINVIMRHDGADGELAHIRSSAGVTHSAFASRPVLVQEHTLGLRGGDDLSSSSLSVALGSVGSYVPGGESWSMRSEGAFRRVGAHASLTGTARLYAKDAGIASSPLVASFLRDASTPSARQSWRGGPENAERAPSPGADVSTQSVREYTLGTTATVFASEHWTHALTVGADGYRLDGDPSAIPGALPSAADSALRAARGGADRVTLRASSEARIGSVTGAALTMNVAAERSALEQRSNRDESLPLSDDGRQHDLGYSGWQSNTGLVGQLDGSWRNALFATAGLRVERNDGLAATNGLVSLPMAGAAVVHDFGRLTTKLRASYGKSIRPAGSVLRSSWIAREAIVQNSLAPEEQAGIEMGIDAFVGQMFAVHLTRFDQTAYNLIQPVLITSSLVPNQGDLRALYALQNVGEISNSGWELESSLTHGALALTGTFTAVDSHVRSLAFAYSGDLRPGDRMLAVPARTIGLTAAWTAARWSSSLSLSRASDWINYDALALASASATQLPIVGQSLRDYWRTYPGVTRFDVSVSRTLFRGIGAVFTGRNLLDVQRNEPDNLTVLPGRTLSAGLQAKF